MWETDGRSWRYEDRRGPGLEPGEKGKEAGSPGRKDVKVTRLIFKALQGRRGCAQSPPPLTFPGQEEAGESLQPLICFLKADQGKRGFCMLRTHSVQGLNTFPSAEAWPGLFFVGGFGFFRSSLP